MEIADLPPFITLIIGSVSIILIMFLPALLELKRPKDAGPRKITDEPAGVECQLGVPSMERSYDAEVDKVLIKKIADIIAALPNLEI